MYAAYERSRSDHGLHYRFIESVSLFGCNEGYIPWLLGRSIKPQQNEPFRWHLDVHEALSKEDMKNRALIIDLKPNNVRMSLSLYEIADVSGVSDSGWTPIMFRLRGLFVEHDPEGIDDDDFIRQDDEIDEPIFSMLYLNGSVREGKLIGRWTAPRASPTNSALLWPQTLEYFAGEARRFYQA